MKIIGKRVHAILDYFYGVLAIASPWLFGFADFGTAKWCAVVVGVLTLVMSLLTDYEGGKGKLISMPMHLNLDLLIGVFFAASPWLFGFSELVRTPHVVFGIFALVASMLTVRTSLHTNVTEMGR